jgi:hypothetical protein
MAMLNSQRVFHILCRACCWGHFFWASQGSTQWLPGDSRAPEWWQPCASQISIFGSVNLGGNNPDIKKKHNETFQNDIYIYMILYVCMYVCNIYIYMILVKWRDSAWFGRDLALCGSRQPLDCVKWSNIIYGVYIWHISLGAPLLYWLYSQTQNSTKQLQAEKNNCVLEFLPGKKLYKTN